MRLLSSSRLRSGLALALVLVAGRVAIPNVGDERGELRVEFETPADWRYMDGEGCTRCRNLGDDQSRVTAWGPGVSDAHDIIVPAGAILEMCAP